MLEVPAELYGPTQVSASATEGTHISKIFISQPYAYDPSMTGKRYGYVMTQLESHGVLHPDTHMFEQEYFYQDKPEVVITIMTQLELKAVLK